MAVRTLEFLEDYFDIPYPLKKLDVVIVHDMDVGAMENWGCIIASKRYLKVDKFFSILNDVHYLSTIIAHEIAHMWYGNLVTMTWWNEGFAKYMESYILKNSHMGKDEDFLPRTMEKALNFDCSATAHPIEVYYESVSEKGDMFDTTTYSKGACLVKMLSDYVGSEEIFRSAIRNYLKNHLYGNVITQNLWDECTLIGDLLVDCVMETWVSNKG
jgi:aminopeptidase N